MAAPIILSTGATSGPGIAGVARDDLVAGEVVTLTDEDAANFGATYFWEFTDVPLGTAPVLAGHTTASPTFTTDPDPALAGTYRVKATVNGIESASELIAVSLPTTGARIPAFNEETQYDGAGNTKGWHASQTKFMREVDQRLPQAGSVTITRIAIADRHSHNSEVPLVVGAFSIDPTAYDLPNVTTLIQIVAVAANGVTPLESHIVLYNLTDDEAVASSLLTITDQTAPDQYLATLVRGAGAGLLKNTECLYECRIYLDAAPGDPETDTIELFKVELRVTQTIG